MDMPLQKLYGIDHANLSATKFNSISTSDL